MEKTHIPYGENGYTLWSVCRCSIGCSGLSVLCEGNQIFVKRMTRLENWRPRVASMPVSMRNLPEKVLFSK